MLTTEQREVSDFSAIDVGSVVKLEWHPEPDCNVEVMVEDNLRPLLVTAVSGNTLKVYFTENVQPTKDVVVKVTSPDLLAFTGGGATESTLNGVSSDRLRLELNGSSECTVEGTAQLVAVACSGASNLKAGNFVVGSTSIVMTGSSNAELHAVKLHKLQVSGASEVAVTDVDSDELAIESSGSAECKVSGKCAKLTVQGSGAASVQAAGLTADRVEVDMSGSSNVEVDAVNALTGTASGASSVRYSRSPMAQSVRRSGAASVDKK